MIVIQLLIGFILLFLILRWPYLGIVFTTASLLVVDLLPQVSVATSVVPIIGGITIVGLLFHKKKEYGKPLFRFENVHILALLYIGWIFITNPQAAWFGIGRNWLITYIQLWIFVWMTGELLDTPKKHHVLMWVYSIVAVISALVTIQQGKIESALYKGSRGEGFVDDPNIAAQYYIVGMLFLNYLRTIVKKPLPRLLVIGGMIVTFLGVFFTISRTGILIIFITLGLLVLMNPGLKHKLQLIIMFLIGLITTWLFSDNIIVFLKGIIPSIVNATDTVGLRYSLWITGWRMWVDNPVQGVGVGMYSLNLAKYGLDLLPHDIIVKGTVTHNMYIQVLAETGFVGFALFMFLILKSLQNIWRAGRTGDPNTISLRNVWLVVFLVMLIGGITLSSQYDKLVWFVMGVSIYFRKLVRESTSRNFMNEQRESSITENFPQL